MKGRQRFGAYGVCLDGSRILLTLWAGDPEAGKWTLPGGGIHFGEHPEAALAREFYEETGLEPEIGSLLDVDSVVYPPWGGRGELHAVRFLYKVSAAGTPRVVEEDGSTIDVAWVEVDRVGSLDRVDLVDRALRLEAL